MNIIFLGSISSKNNRLDGVTIKSRCLKKWLENKKDINLTVIDTDDWTKNFIKISFNIMLNIFKADKIIICSAQRGANLFLRFIKLLNLDVEIYYFVAGGRLGKYIKNNIYKSAVYQNIRKIYVESDKMVEELKTCGLNNVEKVWNFRNIEFNNTVDINEKIKFVFFSRVIKEKGIEDLIYSFNRLKKKYNDITLDIYGQVDPVYLNKLTTIMDEGIKYNGAITPNNKKEYEILSKYDVFVFPTYYEGECLPGALIDAYISGLAIIASEWEYSREYIEDNKVGYIHKYKDKYDLLDKMDKIIQDKERLLQFKVNSKLQAMKFNVNNVLKECNFEYEISNI